MARTGENILNSLWTRAINEELVTSKFEQGRLGLVFSVIAKEFSFWETAMEDYIKEMNLVTASTEENVEKLAMPLHSRNQARRSNVVLRFTRLSPNLGSITIPVAFQVETAGSTPIIYKTVEEKTMYDDYNYVDVRAISIDVGSTSMVLADQLTVMIKPITTVTVTNPEESWGATDLENIETTRTAALTARYVWEKGTEIAIKEALRNYGLETYEYNIVDLENGDGTFSVYVDTEIDRVITEIKNLLNVQKASGIYMKVQKTTPLEFNFTFTVLIARQQDLLPAEATRLESDLNSALSYYILHNGVGKKLVLSKAVHYIYGQLLDKYDLADLELTAEGWPTKLDYRGNIVLENDEIINVSDVTANVSVG